MDGSHREPKVVEVIHALSRKKEKQVIQEHKNIIHLQAPGAEMVKMKGNWPELHLAAKESFPVV